MKKAESKPHIVFVAWKDITHPAAGGAETVHQELSKRLVLDGFTVTHLVPGYQNCQEYDTVDGVNIHRIGKSILAYYFIPFIFLSQYKSKTDTLIECFNCFNTFSWLFFKNSIFFIHHIQDSIWWTQTEFEGVPKWFLIFLNPIGYVVEKLQLLFTGLFFRGKTLTISDSTAQELAGYRFNPERITVVPECGIANVDETLTAKKLWDDTEDNPFTIIHIGMRKMKRPMDVLKAFEIFNKLYPFSKLVMVSGGGESSVLKDYVKTQSIPNVDFAGRVSEEEKYNLLRKSHLLVAASVKEGWGLIVTEANSVGTPALTYNVPGLIDSNKMGYITTNNSPIELANEIENIYKNKELYKKTRQESWNYSMKFVFENSYQEFKQELEIENNYDAITAISKKNVL